MRTTIPLMLLAALPHAVRPSSPPFEGRVFVLVLDDLHPRFSHTSRPRAAGRQFVERYAGANDSIAGVNTSGYGKSRQDFTSNRQLALKAIDAAMGNKADSSTVAALQDYNMNRGVPGAPATANASFNEIQRYTNARNTLSTLRNLADFMAGKRRRRQPPRPFSGSATPTATHPQSASTPHPQ